MPHTYVVCFSRLLVNENNSCDLPLYFERALTKNKQILFKKKILILIHSFCMCENPQNYSTFSLHSKLTVKRQPRWNCTPVHILVLSYLLTFHLYRIVTYMQYIYAYIYNYIYTIIYICSILHMYCTVF